MKMDKVYLVYEGEDEESMMVTTIFTARKYAINYIKTQDNFECKKHGKIQKLRHISTRKISDKQYHRVLI